MDIFDMFNMSNAASPLYQANEITKNYMNNERLNEEEESRNRRMRDGYESYREEDE